jgi:NADPH:quinone reductase-like Zn-dependent oxidoreductase
MAVVVPHASHGAYSESLVVPADSVVHAPAGTSHAEASTLPMNGLTARLTLDLLGLAPGSTLAVTGAAGCYGGYAVQLAKAEGLRVIADAAPADEELVRSFGADVVVPRGPEVAAHIRHVVPDGVDALADGSVQNAAVVAAVRDGGTFASVRGFVGESARAITFHQVWVRNYARRRDKLEGLRVLAEAGGLTLRVARTFPAENAAEAHRMLEAGGVRGRLVLEF